MNQDWPTKKQDLENASSIIEKHVVFNDGEPLDLMNLFFHEEPDWSDLILPDWALEVTDFFVEQYGYDKGHQIAGRVLAKCLLSGHTVH